MNNNVKNRDSFLKTISLPLIVTIINLLILLFPKESIAAAKDGLDLWFKNVLPSLLPFLIGTNLLSSIGFVDFLGVLLNPVMRPLFGVSGNGGFALTVGLLSGYPMGAKITAFLNEKGSLAKDECERLITFVNNSGPLFIIGSVGAGMFANVYAGYFILLVHYISAFSTGILFRLYKYKKPEHIRSEKYIIQKAYRSLQNAKLRDPRPFGAKLGDSVAKSMETMLQIGGFIIFFCVLVKILEVTNTFYLIETVLNPVLIKSGIPKEICRGLLAGTIEITNGIKILSENGLTKSALIASAAIISWGGFSIHAQSISFLSKANISALKYLSGKLINMFFAVVYGLIFYPLFRSKILSSEAIEASNIYDISILSRFVNSSLYFVLTLAGIFFIGLTELFLKTVVFRNKARNSI